MATGDADFTVEGHTETIDAIVRLTETLHAHSAVGEQIAAARSHLIRQARRQGYTLEQLARVTGLDQSRISRIASHEQ